MRLYTKPQKHGLNFLGIRSFQFGMRANPQNLPMPLSMPSQNGLESTAQLVDGFVST